MKYGIVVLALQLCGLFATNAMSTETNEQAICSLPAVRGPCRAYFIRWHYNSNTGRCEQFVYGGCRGNANNFNTKQECEHECKHNLE